MRGGIVLGTDPGFASFGWALVRLEEDKEVVLDMGVLRTQPSSKKRSVRASEDNFRRAKELANGLRRIVNRTHVRAIAAEGMSFPRNSSTAAKMALSWGVLADVCEQGGIPFVQATPQEIKMAVTESKKASKEEVQNRLEARLGSSAFDRFTTKYPSGMWEHGFDAVGAVIGCLSSEVLHMVRKLD